MLLAHRYEHMGTWKPHQGFLIDTGNATSVNVYPQIAFQSVGAVCKKQHCRTICAAGSFICLCCCSFRYHTGSRQKEFKSRDSDLPGYIGLLWVSLWIWILSHESSLPLKSQTVTLNSLVSLARQQNITFFSLCDCFNLNEASVCLIQHNLSQFLYLINHWLVLAPHNVTPVTAESFWDHCLITSILMTCHWILCKQQNT